MRAVKLLSLLLMVGASCKALACGMPSLIQIPLEEDPSVSRTLVQLEMIRYIGAMSSYVNCLQEDHQTASAAGAPELHLSLLATRNNHGVAELRAMQQLYVAAVGPIEELAEIEREECIDGGAGWRDMILDDQTIIFYTRGGEAYLNVLAESCPILRANNSSLDYAMTRAARFVDNLCSGNPLSDSTTPVTARRCLLGSFYPITEDEAEALRSR